MSRLETARDVAYDFAVLRASPKVHLGEFVNVGVVVHARTAEFLALRALVDVDRLRERLPSIDAELLVRYLHACSAICAGSASAGAVALAPPSERFHWITAPRSDVLHCGPVHEGVCEEPLEILNELYELYVSRES